MQRGSVSAKGVKATGPQSSPFLYPSPNACNLHTRIYTYIREWESAYWFLRIGAALAPVQWNRRPRCCWMRFCADRIDAKKLDIEKREREKERAREREREGGESRESRLPRDVLRSRTARPWDASDAQCSGSPSLSRITHRRSKRKRERERERERAERERGS